jgi:hypothetical protein
MKVRQTNLEATKFGRVQIGCVCTEIIAEGESTEYSADTLEHKPEKKIASCGNGVEQL